MARKARRASQEQSKELLVPQIHPNAAGIDVGSESHFVAVPKDRDKHSVREFGSFTQDLYRLADWLKACRIDTVAMESTGVYWIPLYEVLDRCGIRMFLVSPKGLRHAPARKSDVSDCQWLQELHASGYLVGAFRPEDQEVVLRSYIRQRQMLVTYKAKHIQHMQKALTQMNVLLHHAVSDITGVTGMRIIRAILDGERAPHRLAALREPGVKKDAATIAKALQGNWRQEHLFALRQAVELFEEYRRLIQACDEEILAHIQSLTDRTDSGTGSPPPPLDHTPRKNEFSFDAASEAYRLTGVDLTRIEGIQGHTALLILSEIGRDVAPWPTEKRFTSWLALCPNNRISGGKRLRHRKAAPNANRVAQALKVAAHSLHNSKSALGAFYRRIAARLGKERAIQATARKLAVRIYHLLKHGTDYIDPGQDYYERTYRDRVLKNLTRRAKQFGFALVKAEEPMPA